VLSVGTLVVGNDCRPRSQTIDLMILLERLFPDFIRHNKETPNTTGLTLSKTAQSYFSNGGPELADEYAPWLVDVMPTANWVTVVMAISLLFNAMGVGHRFQLWRIDAARVTIEGRLGQIFHPTVTVGDLAQTAPSGELLRPEAQKAIAGIIADLEALAARS